MTIEGSGSDPHGRPLVPGGTTVVAAQGASEGTSSRPPLLGFTKFTPSEHIALGTVNDDLLQSQLAHTSGPAADYFFLRDTYHGTLAPHPLQRVSSLPPDQRRG